VEEEEEEKEKRTRCRSILPLTYQTIRTPKHAMGLCKAWVLKPIPPEPEPKMDSSWRRASTTDVHGGRHHAAGFAGEARETHWWTGHAAARCQPWRKSEPCPSLALWGGVPNRP